MVQGGPKCVVGEEIRKVDGCDTEKFGALDVGEKTKTIAILGDRW